MRKILTVVFALAGCGGEEHDGEEARTVWRCYLDPAREFSKDGVPEDRCPTAEQIEPMLARLSDAECAPTGEECVCPDVGDWSEIDCAVVDSSQLR